MEKFLELIYTVDLIMKFGGNVNVDMNLKEKSEFRFLIQNINAPNVKLKKLKKLKKI